MEKYDWLRESVYSVTPWETEFCSVFSSHSFIEIFSIHLKKNIYDNSSHLHQMLYLSFRMGKKKKTTL